VIWRSSLVTKLQREINTFGYVKRFTFVSPSLTLVSLGRCYVQHGLLNPFNELHVANAHSLPKAPMLASRVMHRLMLTSRLALAWLGLQLLLTSCTILPIGTVLPQPVPIRTNLLVSENDLALEPWTKNRASSEAISTQSDVLYQPPAPSYTYPLTSRLTVNAGLGTPSVYQVIAGTKQYHSYRMTAVLQGYDEGAAVTIRFARALDKSTYPKAETLLTLNQGVQRVTFEFFLEENVDSIVFSLEPKLQNGQFIDMGELRVWDSTPNLVATDNGTGCQLFPSNNFWNVPVDDWAVHPDSSTLLNGLRYGEELLENGYLIRPNFGAASYRNSPIGMPINVVEQNATERYGLRLKFVSFADPAYPPAAPFDAFRKAEFRSDIASYLEESDDILYPIPDDVIVQGVPLSGAIDVSSGQGYLTDSSGYADPALDPDLNTEWVSPILQQGSDFRNCNLYEIYKLTKIANQPPGENWRASSAASWDLSSNTIQGKRGKEFLTSISASGLPLSPSLVRYDEIERGEIKHALGMITSASCDMVWPARHLANYNGSPCVPLGIRLRLKPNFLSNAKHINCTMDSFSPEGKLIILALQRYGSVIVDNGTSLAILGTHDKRWGPSVDRFGNQVGGNNPNRTIDIKIEVYTSDCWPRIEDFEVVEADRYAHWSFARDDEGNVLKSQYSIYNNRPVYNSMGVYGE
jgi:hypothetical protein